MITPKLQITARRSYVRILRKLAKASLLEGDLPRDFVQAAANYVAGKRSDGYTRDEAVAKLFREIDELKAEDVKRRRASFRIVSSRGLN
jgi:hypothetical protein